MPYSGPPAPGAGPQPVSSTAKGLFGSLFDFSFRHFATPHIVKIVYILVTVLIGLGAVAMIFTSFGLMTQRNGAVLGLFTLILTPVGALVYLALARMTMELYVAVTRCAEELSRMNEKLTGR